MGDEHAPSRSLRRYAGVAAIVAVWVLEPVSRTRWPMWLREHLEEVITRVLSGFPGAEVMAVRTLDVLREGAGFTFYVTLFLATLALPLGLVARMVARARRRAGHADPIERASAWSTHRPRPTAVLTALPSVFLQGLFLRFALRWHAPLPALLAVVGGLGYLQWRLLRAGLRGLLAPTLPVEASAPDGLDPAEIRFGAVAVTRETQGAVSVVAALTVVTVAWLMSLPVQRLFSDERVFWAIGGYVAVAAGGALLFQRASKIAVGVDGIYVGGTSRARFFAYRDLDEVVERAGDLELRRGGSLVLRLQLHGQDATRRAAIAERIGDSIARVARVERDGAAHFVTSTSSGAVARSARGGTDYRTAAVSRDALWSLVEGAGVDDRARTAAARALAETGEAGERARLRVAAARCADPKVRVVLEELSLEADDAVPREARAEQR